jgi:hypothetical protein
MLNSHEEPNRARARDGGEVGADSQRCALVRAHVAQPSGVNVVAIAHALHKARASALSPRTDYPRNQLPLQERCPFVLVGGAKT